MRKVLVLGIGGSGCSVAEIYSETVKNNENIEFLGIDTDFAFLEKASGIKTLCLTDYSSLGKVVDVLGKESVSEWFPCDDKDGKVQFFRSMEMGMGANGWRMKGLLSFEYMLSDEEKREAFHKVLDRVAHKDHEALCEEIEVIIVNSLCGGTGSALFLPVALYVKRYLKNKYGKEVVVKGLVSCPDIYEDCLTSENKIKAYANAYAALKEFNAVDLVSKGYNEYAKKNSKSKIVFKIGSEKSKGIGVLFDSEKKEFFEKIAQPFDKLYLFDRIVGVNTIKANEQIMVKVLELIENEKISEREENVYAGISISEVVFEYNSVIDYVAVKKTYDDIENEWSWLYSIVLRDISNAETAPVEDGKNYIYRFASALVKNYQSVLGTKKYSEYLALGRDKSDDGIVSDIDVEAPEITEEQIDCYISDITKAICTFFSCDASIAIDEELKFENCLIQSVRLFDSKRTKQKKFDAFLDKFERCNKYLADYCRNLAQRFNEIVERVSTGIFNDGGELSLKSKLLSSNGRRLHPVTSLLVLSACYLRLLSFYDKNTDGDKAFFVPDESKYLPLNILQRIDFSRNINYDGYSALGVARMTEVLKSSDKKIIRAYDDIVNDLSTAKNKITKTFMSAVLDRVAEEMEKTLQKYVTIFDALPVVLSDNNVDVKIALLNNTANTCIRMNVGCSVETKEKAYEIYAEDVKNDFSFDGIAGNIFDECIKSDNFTELIFKRLSDERRKFVRANEKISALYHTDVLRVLHDKDLFDNNYPKRSKYNDLKQAFSLTALPLNIEPKGDNKEGKIKTETITLVPKEAGEFAKKILGEEGLSSQDAVEKYLFQQNCIDNRIMVSDFIAANKIFSIKKVRNFDLYSFNKVDEKEISSKYYKNYVKSQTVKEEQFTQMWNPHIGKDRFGEYLPFINPSYRDEYEKGVYKAVLYMLNRGAFIVKPNVGNYDVFYYLEGDKQNDVFFEGTQVLLNKTERLFGFMRENATLAVKYAQKFDDELDKEVSSLPLNGYDKVDLPLIEKAILRSDIVNMLTGDMYAYVRSVKPIKAKSLIDFVVEMLQDVELKFETENLVKVIAEILTYAIRYRTANNIENEETLYSAVMSGIKNKYEAQAKQKGKRKYKENSDVFFDLFEKVTKNV